MQPIHINNDLHNGWHNNWLAREWCQPEVHRWCKWYGRVHFDPFDRFWSISLNGQYKKWESPKRRDQGEIHFMVSFNFWILMFNSKRAQVQKTNRQGKVISLNHQWYQRILHMQRDVNRALDFLLHLPISRLDIINPALMVSQSAVFMDEVILRL